MFCPQCGQQQVSGVVRFCSRCGFPLDGVIHLLANGGMLPVYRTPEESNQMSPRKRGVRQGGVLLLSGALIVPILGVLDSFARNSAFLDILVAFAAIICFVGGPLRMLYASVSRKTHRNRMPLTAKDVCSPEMSTVAEYLVARIKCEGPITFCDWMEAALYHPTLGYYCRSDRKRWGREGDYRTSPESSGLFAAAFARHFASLYEEVNRPIDWTIVEIGAGDGCFARDVLQTLKDQFPHVFYATRYLIDEASADSRERASKQIAPFGSRARFETLKNLDRINPGIIFSNELLDSFPVHRLTIKESKLVEFYVTVTPENKFVWVHGALSTPGLSHHLRECGIELAEDQVLEVNLAIDDWFVGLAEKLVAGYLITVDYGAEVNELYDVRLRSRGTLRAYCRHQFVDDVLARPGESDITTTIDWTQVQRLGKRFGFEVMEFSPQDKFLLRAGLLEELARQSKSATGDAEKLRLSAAAREMILPCGMAANFQVMVQKRVQPSC